jgi:uncharacterized protein (DUF885 family)
MEWFETGTVICAPPPLVAVSLIFVCLAACAGNNGKSDEIEQDLQLFYDVCEWYLADGVEKREYRHFYYPVTHTTTGVQNQLILMLEDFHRVANQQDAEDHVARLQAVPHKLAQLETVVSARRDMGIVPPTVALKWTLGSIDPVVS